MNHLNRYVKEVYWQDVQSEVSASNSELGQLIDALSPGNEYPLLQVDYPYGQLIFRQGKLVLPNQQGEYVDVDDPSIPQRIQQLLNYSIVPMALILEHSCEVYVETPNRLTPLTFFNKGSLFGLWETLDNFTSEYVGKMWNVSAGARSVFMLPKITDAHSHNRLRRTYKFEHYLPNQLKEHWQIFKEIAKQTLSQHQWHCRILFFTKPWYNRDTADPLWKNYNIYLYQQAWSQTIHWRNRMYFELIWEAKVLEIFNQNIKYKPYTINTAKHLVYMAMGVFPGFVFSEFENNGGPFLTIAKAYQEVYGLKQYLPIILRPKHLTDAKKRQDVYYSLQSPTLLEYTRMRKKPSTAMADLRDLKQLLELFKEKIVVDDHLLARLLGNIEFSYYHSDSDPYDEVLSTTSLYEADPRLQRLFSKSSNQYFANSGPFLRGCIGITKKNESA